jgi:hypothetical protein
LWPTKIKAALEPFSLSEQKVLCNDYFHDSRERIHATEKQASLRVKASEQLTKEDKATTSSAFDH